MKIKSIHSYLKKAGLKNPYAIAYGQFDEVEIVFIEIELANGIIGVGSASPAEEVVGENSAQTLIHLQSSFVQSLIGRDIRHFQQIIDEIKKQFDHLPGTQAALDIALHDAFCKYLGIPVCDFYGRKIKSLPTSVTIGIKSVAETLSDAIAYEQMGFTILKVKTGISVEEDIERVIKLFEHFNNRLLIRVDANQGYSLLQLKQFIKSTNQFNLELIEQPLAVGKENELMEINDRSKIAGDESIKDAHAAMQFGVGTKPFGIYNIKLMKCGGIMGAREIAQIAHQAKIDLFWGCNDESILSITAALHIAYASANTKYLDLDGNLDLLEDWVTGGFTIKDGHLLINDQPGFGITKRSN